MHKEAQESLPYDCEGVDGHLKPRCEGRGPLDAGLWVLPLRAALAARLAAIALGEVARVTGGLCRTGIVGVSLSALFSVVAVGVCT